MKQETKSGLILAGLVVGLLLGVQVWAAQWVSGSFSPPSYLQTVTNTTLTTNSGPQIAVMPGTGMSLWVASQGNSTNALTVVTGWDVSPDGTNWTTTTPWKLTNTLASGNVTLGLLQLSSSNLLNVQYIKQTYISGAGATAQTNTGSGYSFFY